jgi:hypothetical protein
MNPFMILSYLTCSNTLIKVVICYKQEFSALFEWYHNHSYLRNWYGCHAGITDRSELTSVCERHTHTHTHECLKSASPMDLNYIW